jgi:hypothetical protein
MIREEYARNQHGQESAYDYLQPGILGWANTGQMRPQFGGRNDREDLILSITLRQEDRTFRVIVLD